MVGTCTATTKSGRPCSAQAWQDGLCRWHSPHLQEQRAEWRRRGGEQRSNRARAKKTLPDGVLTPRDLQGLLGATLKGVLVGRIEPGVANAAANLGRTLMTIRETADLEERIAALEERAGVAGGKTA